MQRPDHDPKYYTYLIEVPRDLNQELRSIAFDRRADPGSWASCLVQLLVSDSPNSLAFQQFFARKILESNKLVLSSEAKNTSELNEAVDRSLGYQPYEVRFPVELKDRMFQFCAETHSTPESLTVEMIRFTVDEIIKRGKH